MSAHSHLGPSSAKRWLNCAGSVALCAKAPKEPTSIYAAEGQVAHTLAEEFVLGKLTLEALQAKVGEEITQEGQSVEVIQEMVDGAVEYLGSVEEARRYFQAFPRPKPPVEKLEGKVIASSMDPDKGDVWGRCDYYAYRKGDKLFVFDYKFGRRPVDPDENEQACAYAIAVMDQEAGWAFTEIEIRIIQPRDMSGGGTTKTWVTTPAWLKTWRDTVAVPAVRETRKEGAELRPGSWCDESFCSARAFCPALRKSAGDVAQSDFALMPAKALPEITLLTTEQQEVALLWRDNLKGWLNALEAALQGKAETGESLKYWKLVEGRANRKWTDETEVEKTYGEAAIVRKVLSPNQLEMKLKLKAEDTAALWHKPEGRKTLAPVSDKRTKLGVSVREDFTPTCKNCGVGFCMKHPKSPTQKGPVWPV